MIQFDEHIFQMGWNHQPGQYCWCFRNPAFTSWYGKYPIIFQGFSTIPSGDRRISEPLTVGGTFTTKLNWCLGFIPSVSQGSLKSWICLVGDFFSDCTAGFITIFHHHLGEDVCNLFLLHRTVANWSKRHPIDWGKSNLMQINFLDKFMQILTKQNAWSLAWCHSWVGW